MAEGVRTTLGDEWKCVFGGGMRVVWSVLEWARIEKMTEGVRAALVLLWKCVGGCVGYVLECAGFVMEEGVTAVHAAVLGDECVGLGMAEGVQAVHGFAVEDAGVEEQRCGWVVIRGMCLGEQTLSWLGEEESPVLTWARSVGSWERFKITHEEVVVCVDGLGRVGWLSRGYALLNGQF
eukprot:1156671-Pelagomonas_calceolata.AAC.5